MLRDAELLLRVVGGPLPGHVETGPMGHCVLRCPLRLELPQPRPVSWLLRFWLVTVATRVCSGCSGSTPGTAQRPQEHAWGAGPCDAIRDWCPLALGPHIPFGPRKMLSPGVCLGVRWSLWTPLWS